MADLIGTERRIERRRRPLLRKLVGDVLRRNRLEQRRTLADVARDARVSKPYLSEIERGRKEASSEVLGAICGALRLELADLLAAVGQDLTKDRPALHIAQKDVPASVERRVERTAETEEREHGRPADRAPIISLDQFRQRRDETPAPARFGDVRLAA